MKKLIANGTREAVVKRLQDLGFTYVALDLAGYRMGSLNTGPAQEEKSV